MVKSGSAKRQIGMRKVVSKIRVRAIPSIPKPRN